MTAILRRTTPNQSPRPEGLFIDAIILHADASKNEQGTVSWIASAESKVSYHYLISRTGTVYQFVDDDQKAWHAGKSSFKGRPDCNRFSLGVSFANDQAGEAFPEAQIAAGVELVSDLCRRHSIPVDRITTHAAVSPGRKTDPGLRFPMTEFLTRVRAELP